MTQSKFYFYRLRVEAKEGESIRWGNIFDGLLQEAVEKNINYESYTNCKLSIHITKKENIGEEKSYSGYLVISEDKETYHKEKKGKFLDIGFDDDESLCHRKKGKLFFLFNIQDNGDVILMLEKQHFSLNITGFLAYLRTRYSRSIEELRYNTLLGKDLTSAIKSLKDNKLTLLKVYFKKHTPADRLQRHGYVEDEIKSLKEKGINANLSLTWDEPITVSKFFKTFFNKRTFEDALEVNFGEFLKVFSFKTNNSVMPTLNLLDNLICFTLPLDKSNYDDDSLFTAMKEYYVENRESIE